MVLILKGKPKSTSHIYKMTCRGRFASMYMSADGKALKESYAWQAKEQWKEPVLIGDIYVSMKIYFDTKRKSDIDNFNKLTFDSLTGIVWQDDSQIRKILIEKFYDKNSPRIEICVHPFISYYGTF
jgi:Holliday junction resolvase RusA-like endonuclease